MPKSKRNKIVHLTQVKKKGKDHKEDLMKQIESYVKEFETVYLFNFDQTKSDRIMNLRLRMKEHGRIFAGRNSVVAQTLKLLGKEMDINYKRFLKHVSGHMGLLFTNLECKLIVQKLEKELPEFRDKLVGYANLKAPEVGTSNKGDDDDDDDDDCQSTRYVIFRPIKKAKKVKTNKAKATV